MPFPATTRFRSASLPSPPSPHNPLAVPSKSALKRPRALSDGDLPSPSEPFHIQFPSVEDNKDALSEEVKLALPLEAELVQTTNMVAEICAYVRELIPVTRRRRRVYSMSREEHRASALRRHANLPPPADWDKIPCNVHFSVPTPRRPALRREQEEPHGVILCDHISSIYFPPARSTIGPSRFAWYHELMCNLVFYVRRPLYH
ncbi:hypothetical protein DFH06DRAFT_1332524 [Mycena polygramma]|nr:hypothetical protein DFH06DRAFT_1332524 [Mycena polygramma]